MIVERVNFQERDIEAEYFDSIITKNPCEEPWVNYQVKDSNRSFVDLLEEFGAITMGYSYSKNPDVF